MKRYFASVDFKIYQRQSKRNFNHFIRNQSTLKSSRFSVNMFTERKVKIALLIYMTAACTFGILIANLDCKSIIFIIPATILSIILLACGFLIYIQPQWVSRLNSGPVQQSAFYCPGVPITPLFAIFLNAVLLMHLSYKTWIRFVVWIAIGLVVYFAYSIRHSNLSEKNKNSQTICEVIPTVTIRPVNGLPAQRSHSSRNSSMVSSRDSTCVQACAPDQRTAVPIIGGRRASSMDKSGQNHNEQHHRMQSTSFPDCAAPSSRQSDHVQQQQGGSGTARESNRMQVTSFSDRTMPVIARESHRITRLTSFSERANTAPELEYLPLERARTSDRAHNARTSRKSSISVHPNNQSFPQQNRPRRQSSNAASNYHQHRHQIVPPWKMPRHQDSAATGGGSKNEISRDEEVTVRLREWRDFLRRQAEERQLAWSMSKLHGNNTTILEVPGTEI